MRIKLFRYKKNDTVTLGMFELFGYVFWTLEDPDKGNKVNVSCIPAGVYQLQLVMSSTNLAAGIDVAFAVLNVTGRTVIRFAHVGNSVDSVGGCVAIGTEVDIKNEVVISSIPAVKLFYKLMDEHNGLNPIELEIIE